MVLHEVIKVMHTDALASSSPLSYKEDDIQKPGDIKQLFSSITYSKVRRRLPSGVEVFHLQRGLLHAKKVAEFNLLHLDPASGV